MDKTHEMPESLIDVEDALNRSVSFANYALTLLVLLDEEISSYDVIHHRSRFEASLALTEAIRLLAENAREGLIDGAEFFDGFSTQGKVVAKHAVNVAPLCV